MKTTILVLTTLTFAILRPAQAYMTIDETRAQQRIADIKTCEATLPDIKSNYDKLIAERKFWKAAAGLRFCAGVLPNNADLNALIADAEIKEHQAIIKDPKASKFEKKEPRNDW